MTRLTERQLHFFNTFGYLKFPGLLADCVDQIDAETAIGTANVLLKYRTDIEKTVKEFADHPEELAGPAA